MLKNVVWHLYFELMHSLAATDNKKWIKFLSTSSCFKNSCRSVFQNVLKLRKLHQQSSSCPWELATNFELLAFTAVCNCPTVFVCWQCSQEEYCPALGNRLFSLTQLSFFHSLKAFSSIFFSSKCLQSAWLFISTCDSLNGSCQQLPFRKVAVFICGAVTNMISEGKSSVTLKI